MPVAAKQVRVFVSSNFRDIHAVRDKLVTVVLLEFPKVAPRWGTQAMDPLNAERHQRPVQPPIPSA
jgi:hypothetical protein